MLALLMSTKKIPQKLQEIVSNRIIHMNVHESLPDKQQVIGERTRSFGRLPVHSIGI